MTPEGHSEILELRVEMMMDLELDIYSALLRLSSGVEYNLRIRFRSPSFLERSRDCSEVMRMLVSCLLHGTIPQLISEFLHKTKETVILHIQADMLGYHGVSPSKFRLGVRTKLITQPGEPMQLGLPES